MVVFIDTSVLVAAMIATENFHGPCRELVAEGTPHFYGHGIAEAFSTLTGGRKSFRVPADVAAELLEAHFVPRLSLASLTPAEMLRAIRDTESRGVRGGGIFDYLHLVAARKATATHFYTLDLSNSQAFRRTGDPEVLHP